MQNGQLLIRAVQGHSMKIVAGGELCELLSIESDLPDVCVHGTYRRHIASIEERGLIPGGGISDRNHVHFASYEPGDGRIISGMRSDCEVVIYIDLHRALQDGVPFFRSANGVILTPGLEGAVSQEYFQCVRYL